MPEDRNIGRRDTSPAHQSKNSENAATRNDDEVLGQRIRQARKLRGLSIQSVSKNTGISIGLISQIERGLSSPSVRVLRRMAEAMHVPFNSFFTEPGAGSEPSLDIIVRRDQRRKLELPGTGIVKEILSADREGILEGFVVRIAPQGSSGDGYYYHKGEELGIVIEGEIELWVDEHCYRLSEGDSFQFDSKLPHRFSNPGSSEALVVWVTTPPTT